MGQGLGVQQGDAVLVRIGAVLHAGHIPGPQKGHGQDPRGHVTVPVFQRHHQPLHVDVAIRPTRYRTDDGGVHGF